MRRPRSIDSVLLVLVTLLACSPQRREPVPAAPCVSDDWRTTYVGYDLPLLGIAGRAITDLWTVGSQGAVLHFDGRQWALVDRRPGNVNDKLALLPEGLLVATYGSSQMGGLGSSSVARYDAHGPTPLGTALDGRLLALYVDRGNSVYALGTSVGQGRIWQWVANDWKAIENDFDQVLGGFSPTRDSVVFVGRRTAPNGVAESALLSFDGLNFTTLATYPATRFEAAWEMQDGSAFVSGTDVTGPFVLHVHEDGTTRESVPGADTLIAFSGAATSDVWALSRHAVYKRHGSQWTIEHKTDDFRLNGLLNLGGDRVLVSADRGIVLDHTCERRLPDPAPIVTCAWSKEVSVSGELARLSPRADGQWALAMTGGIGVLSEDGFESLWSAPEVATNAVWSDDAGHLFAVGYDARNSPATVLIVRCDGGNCEEQDVAVEGQLLGVHGLTAEDVYAVGVNSEGCGVALHYKDSQWTQLAGVPCATLHGIYANAADDIKIVSTVWLETERPFGRIYRYSDPTWTTEVERTAVGLTTVVGSPGGDLYASGINEFAPFQSEPYGAILRFDGTGWSQHTVRDDVGYTSLTTDGDGALWAGALRWREIEQSSVPEIHYYRDGRWIPEVVCGADSQIQDLSFALGKAGVALTREGQIFRRQE